MGLDDQPRNARVYGIITSANGTGRLVTIDPMTGATAPVANLVSGGGPGAAGTTATDIALSVTATGQATTLEALATAYNNNIIGAAADGAICHRCSWKLAVHSITAQQWHFIYFYWQYQFGRISLAGVTLDVLDAGFDISGFSGAAFTVLSTVEAIGANTLFGLNLLSGSLTGLGQIGGANFTGRIMDITVLPLAEALSVALFASGVCMFGISRRKSVRRTRK